MKRRIKIVGTFQKKNLRDLLSSEVSEKETKRILSFAVEKLSR